MRQQRNEIPPSIEDIGHAKWHFRWSVQKKQRDDDSKSSYYEYYEVELDHKPTPEEQTSIKAEYENIP
jgi:hypothetical protein